MGSVNKKAVLAVLVTSALAVPATAAEDAARLAAAEKEGKVVWYTSVDVKVAEGVAEAFRKAYPKIELDVERSGSERVFQRINQEYESGIKNVDVVNSLGCIALHVLEAAEAARQVRARRREGLSRRGQGLRTATTPPGAPRST